MNIEVFDKDEIALECAKLMMSRIIRGFIDKDRVVIALSGGNTPKPVYVYLGKYLRSEEILGEDRELHIIQVDERFTEKNSDRANQKMIRDALNIDKLKHMYYHFIPMRDEVDSIQQAVEQYRDTLEQLKRIDVILLGMGDDAHTASLFPENTEYISSLKKEETVLSAFVKVQNEDRVSLTPATINDAEEKILLITGEKKGKILKEAINSDNIHKYPIKTVIDNTIIFMDRSCEESYMGN